MQSFFKKNDKRKEMLYTYLLGVPSVGSKGDICEHKKEGFKFDLSAIIKTYYIVYPQYQMNV